MQFFDSLKEKYYLLDSQYKSDLKKPQLKQTSANDAELKTNSDISILKKLKNSFNKLNFQRNKNSKAVVIPTQVKKENFLYKKSSVYCIVNKYNEVLRMDSRIIFYKSSKPKPLYFLFMSKHDAIDFLYKVANNNPKAFRRFGLGINSFDIDKSIELIKTKSDRFQFLFINSLQDIEDFLNIKKLPKSSNFKSITDNKTIRIKNPVLDKLLIYRINSYRKDPNLSKMIFLNTNDALKYWKNYLDENNINKKRRLVLKLSALSFENLKEKNFLKLNN